MPALIGRPRARGRLRIYLGTAPGVGKTYSMLCEGLRLLDRGDDVVVGIVETHDRPATEDLLGTLPRVAPRPVWYRDTCFDELDLDTLLGKRPGVVLVDELAHTNVPGSRHDKRWQDVESLLDAGIDVITNLNVQHLSSLADEVALHTGSVDPETVPDDFVASADWIELVDVGPDALRERLEAGLLYDREQSARALDSFFRTERLLALRDLAWGWLAERDLLGRAGDAYPAPAAGAASPRTQVVVPLTGSPDGERVVRRAAEIAATAHADLVGVHVREPSGLIQAESSGLARQRELLVESGGRYTELAGVDEGTTIMEFVQAEGAGHLVLAAARPARWNPIRRSSAVERALRSPSAPELHIVPTGQGLVRSHPPRTRRERGTLVAIPWERRRLGWLLAIVGPAIALAVLFPLRSSVGVAGALFGALTAVVVVAGLGGIGPAALATAIGFLGGDFLFTRPYYSFRVDGTLDIVALVTFVVAAGAVGVLVDRLARQGVRTAAECAEADGLARLLANSITAAPGAVPDLAGELRNTFDLETVELLGAPEPGSPVVTPAGSKTAKRPGGAGFTIELADHAVLIMDGKRLTERDAQLAHEFVRQLRLNEKATQLERTRRDARARPPSSS